MTKGRKKRLAVLIGAVLLVLLAVGVIWRLAFQPGETGQPENAPFTLITNSPDNTLMGGSVNGGVNGMPLDWDLPLPLYSFTPGPEWTQTQDAAQTANRLSFYYEDVYQNDQGATLTFIQEMAITGTQLPAGSTLTEGDTLILFSQGQTTDGTHQSTAIYWIQGPSLLTLRCDRHLSENQMLEFFRQVDYSAPRQPVYAPITFQWRESEDGSGSYTVQGNPEIPEDYRFAGFSQPPAGYSLEASEIRVEYNCCNYLAQELRSDGGSRRLSLNCWLGTQEMRNVFLASSEEAVQQVTVKGNPGYLFCAANYGVVLWVADGYQCLSLSIDGNTTPEALLELAQQVEPMERDAIPQLPFSFLPSSLGA